MKKDRTLTRNELMDVPKKKLRTSRSQDKCVKSLTSRTSLEKGKKTPASPKQDTLIVENGDLVWAKITSHPWWPGLVISHNDCRQKVPKEGCKWVFWLGHNTVSEVSLKNMKYFFDCDESLFDVTLHKRRHYEDGLIAAVKLVAERTEVTLASENTREVLQFAFQKCKEGHLRQISGSIPHFVTDVFINLQLKNIKQDPEECYSDDLQEMDDILHQIGVIDTIKDICLVCHKHDSSLQFNHPLYEGKVCLPCKERIKLKMFSTDVSNKFSCSVCTRKGILDCLSCPRTLCEFCMKSFLPKTKHFKQWKCLICEPAKRSQGLLELRNNFIEEVSNLFTDGTCTLGFSDLQSTRRPMTVLSLFDGIGTGLLVLQKLGISVKKYYACEVDENAITVSKARFGEQITHLGDVKTVNTALLKTLGTIDLLIGGSPCNDLSLANPGRRGFSDVDSTALLFYEYYRILQQVEKNENFFWLFENTANMPNEFEETINRFLQSKPKKIDARFFSAHNRARFFWGNIPAMGKTILPASSPTLDDIVSKTYGRKAQVTKMRTITTNAQSLLGQGPSNILPVITNGKEDTLWITEVEEIFGFPRHFTDVGSLSRKQRLDLLGRAWSIQVVQYILRPLSIFYECLNQNVAL